MGLAEYWQVEVSLGMLCEFDFDVEDAVFPIQMVLFELFKGKHVYRSWYHTSKLHTNLELSSNIYPPNKKSHMAKELPISLTLETQKGRTWRKIFPWTVWKIIKTNTFDSNLTGLNWNSQFKSNSVKFTSITIFLISLSLFISTDNSLVYTLTILSLNCLSLPLVFLLFMIPS